VWRSSESGVRTSRSVWFNEREGRDFNGGKGRGGKGRYFMFDSKEKRGGEEF
jgi:hypothetical protein